MLVDEQDVELGEAGAQLSYPWGSSWPQCECPTTATTCQVDPHLHNLSSAFYRQIHTFGVKSLSTSSIIKNCKAKDSLIL